MTLLTSLQRLLGRDGPPSGGPNWAMNDAGNLAAWGDTAEAGAGRPNGQTGRIKTRMMSDGPFDSYFDATGTRKIPTANVHRPIGWIVVIEGPGTGDWFALESGLTEIGRGVDQDVSLDFGDLMISRSNHAYITYDISTHRFSLCHGDSQNSTKCNGVAVKNTTDLNNGDRIKIGDTTLRFAAFCDDDFQWSAIVDKGASQ